jgi:hypothetical protein
MVDPQVWSNTVGEPAYVVLYSGGVFYADSVDAAKHGEIVKQLENGGDPFVLLGKKCQQAALDDITRVIADNKGKLILECDGVQSVKLPMREQGVKILETIQDEKGQTWASDVRSKVRVGSALLAMVIGTLMGGGLVWVYFGVVSGQIDRIHWLAAILINSLGAESMLVLAAIFFLGGMFGFGYYLTHPAEVWTLEED